MTREEAIELLQKDKEQRGECFISYAIDMAIKALEQESITKNDLGVDCVSRQFMYDLGATCIATRNGNGKLIALGAIEELPSVTPQEPRWIPVSERLPEIHQDILLSLRSLDIEVGFRAKKEPYFYCHGADGCYIEPQNVLAWQPLPEPYNAESEG